MINVTKLTRKRLGELLLESGLVNERQIEEALKRQKDTGELIGEALIGLRHVTEFDIAEVLARQYGLPFIDASRYLIRKEAGTGVPPEFMAQNLMVILDRIENSVLVAIAGPISEEVFKKVEEMTGASIYAFVSTPTQVRDALAKAYTPA